MTFSQQIVQLFISFSFNPTINEKTTLFSKCISKDNWTLQIIIKNYKETLSFILLFGK